MGAPAALAVRRTGLARPGQGANARDQPRPFARTRRPACAACETLAVCEAATRWHVMESASCDGGRMDSSRILGSAAGASGMVQDP